MHASEAEVVWMNTIRLKEETLQQHFSSRLFPICCGVFWYARDFIEMDFVWLFSAAAERIYLGTGLGSALDQETRGFIITCLSAVIECSAYVEVHLEEVRQPSNPFISSATLTTLKAEHIRMTSPSRDADETNDEARVQKIETNIQVANLRNCHRHLMFSASFLSRGVWIVRCGARAWRAFCPEECSSRLGYLFHLIMCRCNTLLPVASRVSNFVNTLNRLSSHYVTY